MLVKELIKTYENFFEIEISLVQTLIIKYASELRPVVGEFRLSEKEELEDEIKKIISRHPLTNDQLMEILIKNISR